MGCCSLSLPATTHTSNSNINIQVSFINSDQLNNSDTKVLSYKIPNKTVNISASKVNNSSAKIANQNNAKKMNQNVHPIVYRYSNKIAEIVGSKIANVGNVPRDWRRPLSAVATGWFRCRKSAPFPPPLRDTVGIARWYG